MTTRPGLPAEARALWACMALILLATLGLPSTPGGRPAALPFVLLFLGLPLWSLTRALSRWMHTVAAGSPSQPRSLKLWRWVLTVLGGLGIVSSALEATTRPLVGVLGLVLSGGLALSAWWFDSVRTALAARLALRSTRLLTRWSLAVHAAQLGALGYALAASTAPGTLVMLRDGLFGLGTALLLACVHRFVVRQAA